MKFISKRWPVERITKLCQLVASSLNGIIIILGSASDGESALEISALLPPETLQFNLCGALSLAQLTALAAQANVALYIGNFTQSKGRAGDFAVRPYRVFR